MSMFNVSDKDNWGRNVLRREAFTCRGRSLRGRPYDCNTGLMSVSNIALYREQKNSDGIDYTIMSYDTPIAWLTGGKWYMPQDRYSTTTSRHQGMVRYVLRNQEVVEL